jgi:hypothetical protein
MIVSRSKRRPLVPSSAPPGHNLFVCSGHETKGGSAPAPRRGVCWGTKQKGPLLARASVGPTGGNSMSDLPLHGVDNQNPVDSGQSSASILPGQTVISSMMIGPTGRKDVEGGRRETMIPLPDDALVVRGGENLPSSFAGAVGSSFDATGKLDDVSVNSAAGLSVSELTKPNRRLKYRGIPHRQVGIATAGAIRAAGGDVVPAPTRSNPNHAILSGLTPEEASRLFRPTIPNPGRSP